MQMKMENKNDVLVCYIDGDIDIHSSPDVKKIFDKLAKDKVQKVVINLASVNYVDSSGLATLVSALKGVKSFGGKLRLVNLSSKVKGLFEITKLDKLFDIKDNEEEALKSLV